MGGAYTDRALPTVTDFTRPSPIAVPDAVAAFPELVAVLGALADGVREVLGPGLLGVYLTGSFAQGAGDAASDVDFMVVTRAEPGPDIERALGAMHASLFERPEQWAQHLEGSYAPIAVLRVPPVRAAHPDFDDPAIAGASAGYEPLLYLNNGARHLQRSEHDNTMVVRWMLREHGLPLWGPPPHELLPPVDSSPLLAEVRRTASRFARSVLAGDVPLDALWLQGFTVLFYCRVLLSLESGRIPSKPEAREWALRSLDTRWAQLVREAWDKRTSYPRGRGAPQRHAVLRPSPESVAETLAFVATVLPKIEL
jgi:hypothetical protein